MQAKKDLARRIVADFHSAEAAAKAGEDWAKQFQKDEVPEDVETVEIRLPDVLAEGKGGGATRLVGGTDVNADSSGDSFAYPIRIDKLLRRVGLAASNTEGAAKVREGSVKIDGKGIDPHEVCVGVRPGSVFIVRVGRRVRRAKVTR